MATEQLPSLNELKSFLIAANRAGYAGGDEKKWVKQEDQSTTIPYAAGDFRMQDNFFGGEPYGGRLVVFYRDRPVWMMVYYGRVMAGVDSKPIYETLKKALMQMPESSPLRGPTTCSDGEYIYMNTWIGEMDNYSGEEQILKMGDVLYRANYLGGWIDLK